MPRPQKERLAALLRIYGAEATYDMVANDFKLLKAALRLSPPQRESRRTEFLDHSGFSALRDAITHAFRRNHTVQVMTMILDLMKYTGLRVGETVALHIGDIDLDNRAVTVRRGKGGKRRTVYMPQDLTDRIAIYLRSLPPRQRFLFEKQGTAGIPAGPYGTRAIQKNLAALREVAAERSGRSLGFVTPHVLRHANATELVASGMPLPLVQKHLGHADPRTTSTIYVDENPLLQRDAMDRASAEQLRRRLEKEDR